MTGIMPSKHPRDRAIVLLTTRRKIKAEEALDENVALEKEVDDLESISDQNELEEIAVKDEASIDLPHPGETTSEAVDGIDAEVIPADIKPTIPLDHLLPLESKTVESCPDVAMDITPIDVKDEIREEHDLQNAAQAAIGAQEEVGPPTPVEIPSGGIVTPDLPIDMILHAPVQEAADSAAEAPPSPISIPSTEIPIELDGPAIPVAAGLTTSVKSTSPLSSIISISPPPPSSRQKQKKPQRPRVQEEPPDEDYLDTSPPELATLTPHGLGPVTTQINNHFLYVFYRFCAERHGMTVKRNNGVPRNQLTEDECMKKERVGNIYRELDPSSKRLVDDIIGKGDQGNEETCFRVFLYSGFYEDATYKALQDGLGEIPSWKKFDLEKYEAILYEKSIIRKEVIYTSAFQLVPPTRYFGQNLPHFAATLRFIMTLMQSGLPEKLLECKYAVDASHILQTFPTLGGFLAQNILVSLNDAPTLSFQYRTFATCGPGSRSYLQRVFGREVINHVAMEQAGLKWLYENQWRYWARLGVDPPHAWDVEKGIRPGMRVLDIENALCWCHRYVNAYQRKGYKSLADKSPPTYDPEITETASMPAWCDEQSQLNSLSRASFIGDYEEESQKLQDEEGEEGVWEIEKVICRKGQRTDRDGLFRVRWKGYPPEEDTWERGSSLKEGAGDVLKEWLEWEEKVWATIAKITKENPYTRPRPGMKVEPKEEKPDTVTMTGAEVGTTMAEAGSKKKRGRPSGSRAGTAGPPPAKRSRPEEVKEEPQDMIVEGDQT